MLAAFESQAINRSIVWSKTDEILLANSIFWNWGSLSRQHLALFRLYAKGGELKLYSDLWRPFILAVFEPDGSLVCFFQ